MSQAFSYKSYHTPVYRKALEIFKLSRAMAVHFTQDKHVLEMATAKNYGSRLERIRKIRKASKSLKTLCRNLEFSGVRESEFLGLLKKEIHLFDTMIADWIQQLRKA